MDISSLHGPDGSFRLRDRSLFSDEADAMITNQELDETSASDTTVYRNVVEFMQDYAIDLGISYIDGYFSRDNWVGSIRQRAFASRDTKVYGISRLKYEKNVRTYHASLPLHVELAAAIDNLPQRIQTQAQNPLHRRTPRRLFRFLSPDMHRSRARSITFRRVPITVL